MTPATRRATGSALVLGGACIEIIRPLALAGVPCHVVAPPNEGSQRSRHARPLFDWNWSVPTDTQDPVLLDRVVRFAERSPEKPVLFYCCEPSLQFVSRNRERLQNHFRFVLPPVDIVEQLSDKSQFAALAKRLRLPVPTTQVLTLGAATANGEHHGIGFPLIVKPIVRDDLWESGAKALRVNGADELRAIAEGLQGADRIFIMQRLIEGPESSIESYHVYVDESREIVAEFSGRKLRTLPIRYGHSTALTTTDSQDVLDLGRTVVRLLGFTGVAKLDFKRSSTGQLYLLEINARFNLWHHLGARVGVNIPALVYGDLTGNGCFREQLRSPRVATWVHPKDVFAARASGIRLREWVRWAIRCEAKAYWSISDPLPLLATTIRRPTTRQRS